MSGIDLHVDINKEVLLNLSQDSVDNDSLLLADDNDQLPVSDLEAFLTDSLTPYEGNDDTDDCITGEIDNAHIFLTDINSDRHETKISESIPSLSNTELCLPGVDIKSSSCLSDDDRLNNHIIRISGSSLCPDSLQICSENLIDSSDRLCLNDSKIISDYSPGIDFPYPTKSINLNGHQFKADNESHTETSPESNIRIKTLPSTNDTLQVTLIL